MDSATEIKFDLKAVENFLIFKNFKHLIIPILISIFLICAEVFNALGYTTINLPNLSKFYSGTLIISTLTYIFTLIQAKSLKYEVIDKTLNMEFGVFYNTKTSVPFHKITDVEIYSGIFEKLLNMEIMKVQTAGRGKDNPEIIIIAPYNPKDLVNILLKSAATA